MQFIVRVLTVRLTPEGGFPSLHAMPARGRKRTAKIKTTLTRRVVDALRPTDKPWIAWDDKLTGFGVRVHPSGAKSFVVNYRAGAGGRAAPNRRVVIGRHAALAPARARRLAQELLGRAAGGGDPAGARGAPTLGEACEDYMAAGRGRRESTQRHYRALVRLHLADWLARPLDAIERRDVEALFNGVTERAGWSAANQTVTLLRAFYRRPCIDCEGLRNPVDLWLAGGGRLHSPTRRRIPTPAEVLPRWRAGIDAAVRNPVTRDALRFGLYTGMRRNEVLTLRWERVDAAGMTFRIEETKTGAPLLLPITRQLAALLERRAGGASPWVFPSPTSASGHIENVQHLNGPIGAAGGAKFWFHALRNCFITVAERNLLLPRGLTKRLVNHARPGDVTEGYAADWSIEQLRDHAQRIADRIDALAAGRRDAP